MKKGFTLIELLVVIAIIAILAAILFPVFARARMAANTTKCLVHGQELGKAMMSYMDDNNGRFPSSATDDMYATVGKVTWAYDYPGYHGKPGYKPPATGRVGGWNAYAYIQLAKYVRNTDIWICPSPEGIYGLKYARLFRNSWMFRDGGGSSYDASFQYSVKLPDGSNRWIGRTAVQVQALDAGGVNEEGKQTVFYPHYAPPSKKIFAYCVSVGEGISVGAWVGGPVVNPGGYYAHNEGSIFVYVDGHAKYQEMGRGMNPVHYTRDPIDEPHTHR